jgi:hypothetical protein
MAARATSPGIWATSDRRWTSPPPPAAVESAISASCQDQDEQLQEEPRDQISPGARGRQRTGSAAKRVPSSALTIGRQGLSPPNSHVPKRLSPPEPYLGWPRMGNRNVTFPPEPFPIGTTAYTIRRGRQSLTSGATSPAPAPALPCPYLVLSSACKRSQRFDSPRLAFWPRPAWDAVRTSRPPATV